MNDRSERASLAAILTMVNAARRRLRDMEATAPYGTTAVSEALDTIEEEARGLMQQVVRGVHVNPHRNPPLLIVNPPLSLGRSRRGSSVAHLGGLGGLGWVERMSEEVHDIRYTHAEDGKDYKHDFEAGVEMWAVTRQGKREIHLTQFSGRPLWADFK